jgi:hypothetical protein
VEDFWLSKRRVIEKYLEKCFWCKVYLDDVG